MALRCASFSKNLSAFLDGELESGKRKQMEIHISECADCRREIEKMQEIIGLIGDMPRPEAPVHLWEGTRRRIEAASELPIRTGFFGLPKWSFAPVGAVVFALLLYFVSSQFFVYKHRNGATPVATYLQEHAISYHDQGLPSSLLPELTLAQAEQVTEKAQYDEPMSELEMLMEVHYGTYSTNGS